MSVLVVSIDGGIAERTYKANLDDRLLQLGLIAMHPVKRIRSVFPSSTAPAHQSIVTGLDPMQHGISGNFMPPCTRKDDQCNTSHELYDPTLWVGPYLRHSTLPGLASTLDDANLRWSSVHFPGLVSRQPTTWQNTHDLLLYGPDLDFTAASSVSNHTCRLFSRELGILTAGDGPPMLIVDGTPVVPITRPGAATLTWYGLGDIYLGGTWRYESSSDTATFMSPIMVAGTISDVSVLPSEAPAITPAQENQLSYRPDSDTPGLRWLLQHCVNVATTERPDVMFARFNHTDHVQELLEWVARLDPDSTRRREASLTIDRTYSAVTSAIRELASSMEDLSDVIMVSDHGITPATMQLSHKWILSHICPEDSWELVSCDSALLRVRVNSANASQYASADPLAQYGIKIRIEAEPYPPRSRDSDGAILEICGAPPIEFTMGDSPPKNVAIGAHGYHPEGPDMDAIFAHFARPEVNPSNVPSPESVCDIRQYIETTLRNRKLM